MTLLMLKSTSLFIITIIILTLPIQQGYSQHDSLRIEISQIIKASNCNVGIAIMQLESRDTLTYNGTKHYAMQSVYKFHVALAILNQVDKQKLALDQNVLIEKKTLITNARSAISQKYPEGNVTLTLSEILQYTVSESDNTGCDVLFKLMEGPKNVEKYIHSLGIKDVAINNTEAEILSTYDIQFNNWSTPLAAVQLLELFYHKKLLKNTTHNFMMKALTETQLAKNRIKGLLPTETTVAHKSGTGPLNDKGLTAVANDIGILWLPNGAHIAIAVFVTDTTQDPNPIIAKISEASYRYFIK